MTANEEAEWPILDWNTCSVGATNMTSSGFRWDRRKHPDSSIVSAISGFVGTIATSTCEPQPHTSKHTHTTDTHTLTRGV